MCRTHMSKAQLSLCTCGFICFYELHRHFFYPIHSLLKAERNIANPETDHSEPCLFSLL